MNYIPISLLHTQAYCEYQIYLKQKGLQAETSPQLLAGIQKHDQLHKKFLETAEPIQDPETHFKKVLLGQEPQCTLREYTVKSDTLGLIGRIDEVVVYKGGVMIIDDKPKATAYMSDKKQVWAYALAFKEMHAPKNIVCCIRNHKNEEIVYEEEYDEEKERMIIETVQRIKGLLNGKIDWIPTQYENKCRACSWNKVCDRSLI